MEVEVGADAKLRTLGRLGGSLEPTVQVEVGLPTSSGGEGGSHGESGSVSGDIRRKTSVTEADTSRSAGPVLLEEASSSSSSSGPACTVTVFRQVGCDGDDETHKGKLTAGQEFALSNDNWMSAEAKGACNKVEFIDQDFGYPGAPDNVIKHGEVDCFDFPYDLKNDMSHLKVWSLPAGVCKGFKCKARHKLKDSKKTCEGTTCTDTECCGALPRCASFTCPKDFDKAVSKWCAGLKCTASECCTETTTTSTTSTTTTTTTTTTATTTAAPLTEAKGPNKILIAVGAVAGLMVLVWAYFTVQDLSSNPDSQVESQGRRAPARRR